MEDPALIYFIYRLLWFVYKQYGDFPMYLLSVLTQNIDLAYN